MAGFNPIRGAMASFQGGASFNPYAAGKKHYGAGRPFPTSGRVTDKIGYAERDGKAEARREALLRRARGGR